VLRLFSDRSHLPDGENHAVILFPFWGKTPENAADPSAGRFDRFIEVGRDFLSLGELGEADVAVFPRDWSSIVDEAGAERARAFVTAAEGTPVAIFNWSDFDDPLPVDAHVFRTSLRRSRRGAREFAHPAWSEDFVERYLGGELPLRAKGPRPVVGFCGLVPRGWRRLASIVQSRRLESATRLRSSTLRTLERAPGVETNFVVRDRFLGGALADAGSLQRVRREYVQNMVDSDYVVCVRGAGNFSYRLYETLSCGRIPVFVDTDCVLPYEREIDWREHCVWVDEHDVAQVGERVLEFHERLSDAEFADRQRACRRLWEDFIRPEGYFAQFHRHFDGQD
jgi:hypothetical protein